MDFVLFLSFLVFVVLYGNHVKATRARPTVATNDRQRLLDEGSRAPIADAAIPVPSAAKAAPELALLPHLADEPYVMSSRELFSGLGMPDGFPIQEWPMCSETLFTKLGMPAGYPAAPDVEPVQVQPATEVSLELPPEILPEEEPLQPWEIAMAENA